MIEPAGCFIEHEEVMARIRAPRQHRVRPKDTGCLHGNCDYPVEREAARLAASVEVVCLECGMAWSVIPELPRDGIAEAFVQEQFARLLEAEVMR